MDKRLEIEMVAYEFYQRDGCLHGRDFDHWLQAEKSVHPKRLQSLQQSLRSQKR